MPPNGRFHSSSDASSATAERPQLHAFVRVSHSSASGSAGGARRLACVVSGGCCGAARRCPRTCCVVRLRTRASRACTRSSGSSSWRSASLGRLMRERPDIARCHRRRAAAHAADEHAAQRADERAHRGNREPAEPRVAADAPCGIAAIITRPDARDRMRARRDDCIARRRPPFSTEAYAASRPIPPAVNSAATPANTRRQPQDLA